jgi:hypothetical protein
MLSTLNFHSFVHFYLPSPDISNSFASHPSYRPCVRLLKANSRDHLLFSHIIPILASRRPPPSCVLLLSSFTSVVVSVGAVLSFAIGVDVVSCIRAGDSKMSSAICVPGSVAVVDRVSLLFRVVHFVHARARQECSSPAGTLATIPT